MEQNNNQEFNSKIQKISLIGAPGAIMVGLALYAIFEAKGDAFHPMLNNMDTVYGMLVIGTAICVWEIVQIIKITKEQASKNNKNRSADTDPY